MKQTYYHIKEQIKTGDAILFSGKGFFSDVIKMSTASKYSHVGLVLKMGLPVGSEPKLFLIESTTLSNVKDVIFDKPVEGLQLVDLDERLNSYDGKAWLLPLKIPLYPQEEAQLIVECLTIHSKHVAYDMNQAIKAGIDLWDIPCFENRTNLDKVFCSEFVTAILQKAGKIEQCVNASEITPGDMRKFVCFDQTIRIL
jgi:hypothetical protein